MRFYILLDEIFQLETSILATIVNRKAKITRQILLLNFENTYIKQMNVFIEFLKKNSFSSEGRVLMELAIIHIISGK